MIPKENLRIGDRVKAYLLRSTAAPADRRSSCRGLRRNSSSSFSSWKCRRFPMASWSSRFAPEIPDCGQDCGQVERSAVDPIGTCVGFAGFPRHGGT